MPFFFELCRHGVLIIIKHRDIQLHLEKILSLYFLKKKHLLILELFNTSASSVLITKIIKHQLIFVVSACSLSNWEVIVSGIWVGEHLDPHEIWSPQKNKQDILVTWIMKDILWKLLGKIQGRKTWRNRVLSLIYFYHFEWEVLPLLTLLLLGGINWFSVFCSL